MQFDAEAHKYKAGLVEKESLLFFKKISKKQMRQLDNMVHGIHDEVFERTDCLSCANCCKVLGPRITYKDIERMAKGLRVKAGEVISKYLHIDEDNDYVFKTMPCPMLMSDNYCSIYEHRPKACREYPHTDRAKFLQITKLSITNSATCPAVYDIIEQLKKEW